MTTLTSPCGTQALISVAGLTTIMAATAWLEPALLPELVAAFLALGIIVLAYRYLNAAWVVWVLITGLSMEMALSDVIGLELFQPVIAAEKGVEIGLVALTILRHGPIVDRFNPAWAFIAMAATGAAVGIHPDLKMTDMARSLVGDITPFLVFCCAKPAGWDRAIRRAVTLVPVFSVFLGLTLDAGGLRPVFVEAGGLRLAGMGHPAFLAGVCLPALYSGLLRWLRTASVPEALLFGINLLILFLTGARAPAAYAAVVIGGTLILAPSVAIPRAHRLVLVATGFTAVPVLLILGESYSSFRLFEVLADGAGRLSGRDLLWPSFEAAAARAPWFGWGLGSGNLVIPHDGPIAVLVGTWAAHNEYLRIQVEGGQVGRALLIALFVLWGAAHTRLLPPLERLTTRLILLTFAAHATTDNVLISSPACVLFAFLAAVFAEADVAAGNPLRDQSNVA